jgi:hypothetical protein
MAPEVLRFDWSPLPFAEVVRTFRPSPMRWWVSGGHGLELHLGRSWRSHDDIDVGLCRGDVVTLGGLLAGWEIAVATDGRLRPWDGQPVGENENNLWARRQPGPWEVDITVGEGDADFWAYRRDQSLTMPWVDAVLTNADGVPYLAPALQLLFKAKDPRPKDDFDAEVVIPTLDDRGLALLHVRLPPEHRWRPLVDAHRH